MQQTTELADVIPLAQRQVALELPLEQARDLLDWLEAHGLGPLEIEMEESGHFKVSWDQ